MTELTTTQIADRRAAAQLVRGFLDDSCPAARTTATTCSAGTVYAATPHSLASSNNSHKDCVANKNGGDRKSDQSGATRLITQDAGYTVDAIAQGLRCEQERQATQ